MEMDRNEAKKYLKRKGKKTTEDNIKKVMVSGKCFGDPLVKMSD
jgi:hypothetical protein